MKTTYSVPVSVKGIVFEDDKVWLRYNQRNEWELPGGKMDEGEQPAETCVREINEELGLSVETTALIQTYLYTIHTSPDESKGVLVISYLCTALGRVGGFETTWEKGVAQFKKFDIGQISDLVMPDFYKEAIAAAWHRLKRS